MTVPVTAISRAATSVRDISHFSKRSVGIGDIRLKSYPPMWSFFFAFSSGVSFASSENNFMLQENRTEM